MKKAIATLEALRLRLSLELNEGNIPEDTDELIEIAEDLEVIRKAIRILKTYL